MKVMSTTALHSTFNILETVRDRGLVPKGRQWEMAYGYQTITWPVTSRGPERWNSWPKNT